MQELKALKEAADYFVEAIGSYKLIPEIRTNIVYAREGATTTGDVAGIPGRITIAFGRAYYCLPPAYGESDHMARLVLSVMRFNSKMRSGINVRYKKGIEEKLDEVFVFNRAEEISKEEGHTMNFIPQLMINKVGSIRRYIVDLGDFGKEPSLFILGETPLEVVKKSLELIEFF
ncbi:hypothetical protein HS7_00190 [Sulfolobales archaeon HS-7]|nr:hypothetical protein HS7_00190 [Sulfolobales archaeon HS-7]